MHPSSDLDSWYHRFSRGYVMFVWRHPILILAVAAALTITSLWLTAQLALRADVKDLRPRGKRSVTEFERIAGLIGGNASFSVGIEGENLPAMKRFADDLTKRLRALPPGFVDHVDDSVRAERRFFL